MSLPIYRGKLSALRPILTRQGGGTVELPGGAIVRVLVNTKRGSTVFIGRRKAPETQKADLAWSKEIAVFREQLGLQHWVKLMVKPKHGGCAVAFYEPVVAPLDQGELGSLLEQAGR